ERVVLAVERPIAVGPAERDRAERAAGTVELNERRDHRRRRQRGRLTVTATVAALAVPAPGGRLAHGRGQVRDHRLLVRVAAALATAGRVRSPRSPPPLPPALAIGRLARGGREDDRRGPAVVVDDGARAA